MSSLQEYKMRLSNHAVNNGVAYKANADLIMEYTWDRDIQSKTCYIYDYYHDDQPWLNTGMTYNNTTKTPINAKFIITQSQSIDKDRTTVMLQFKPSQKLRFERGDDLYYYETDYRDQYNCRFPIGLYCDIPDERGVYRKWIICAEQIGNQFIKYLILPADYRFSWIEAYNGKRIIRRVWGATRSQNSYNSGLWTDYYTTQIENQFKAIIPLNSITEKIFYTDNENQNQRMIISTMTKNPRVWKVSKVEDMLMGASGLMRLTFVQDSFNKDTDFIDYNAVNIDGSNDTYAMYADYYISTVIPIEDVSPTPVSDTCILSASNNTIKVGGSYKTVTATFYDSSGLDVTSIYLPDLTASSWEFYIDDTPVTDTGIITVLPQADANKIKIRFSNDMSYLTKVLIVQCSVNSIVGQLSLEISKL